MVDVKCVAGGVAAFAAAAMVLSALPGSSEAVLCVEHVPLEQAVERNAVVFVGTVEAVRNVARFATVRINEQWKGPDLPDSVEVRGADVDDPNAFTSGDRSYAVGRRYLFLPANDAPPFLDGLCSATTPWSPELNYLRPAQAPGQDGEPTSSSWRLILASLALLAAGGAWFSWSEAKKQRSKPHS